jgi:hypothetical protein
MVGNIVDTLIKGAKPRYVCRDCAKAMGGELEELPVQHEKYGRDCPSCIAKAIEERVPLDQENFREHVRRMKDETGSDE